MTHFTKEVEFPRKRLSIRNTAKLVENRIVALEQYMRRMLHILTLYATMDSSASSTLRHLQTFLGVDNYLDCVHPPPLDDQRFIELMAYQFLNDFGSEACQQCVRFITTVDLDSVVEIGAEGYVPVLNYVRDALSEVEQFVQQQHMSQMVQTLHSRRPDLNEDQQRSFVRKCIRRQVEAALYLPLRRTVFRIVFSFLAGKSKHLQRAITLLQRASPKFLMVDPFVTRAPALPRTVKAFRRVIQAYLPADQGQLLIHAATSVMELHKECQAERNRLAHVLSSIPENGSADLTPTDDIEIPLPRRLSDEVDMQYVSTKTPDLDIGLLVPPPVVPESRGDGDMDLPATPKRPVVTKLRELFSRKKTSEDLFNSSGSDDDEASVSSNSVFGAGGTTPTNSYITGLNSAPNSPMRPAAGTSLFKRLIPRVTSGARNTDTADNLFVDEKKAFTVSVKSDMSNQVIDINCQITLIFLDFSCAYTFSYIHLLGCLRFISHRTAAVRAVLLLPRLAPATLPPMAPPPRSAPATTAASTTICSAFRSTPPVSALPRRTFPWTPARVTPPLRTVPRRESPKSRPMWSDFRTCPCLPLSRLPPKSSPLVLILARQ